ncbi:MAG: hypothetical protein A3C06_00750 [Candidatus Taylorbacteria bacterium RIFCSPHIGHO2_02_FULL_46_13]|uniref:Pyridoxamine 5'-phosphate oxidase N-terminal domain-containing protein n=2 Tax=Parcubacteria group TaxID=1794811 RepID=A0A1G2HSR0_9BACT|nr:MAG: hypothetical protein A2822_03550 [Candidatus Staskawiczbacteria bacterium RIFCSPHIGHO2_01_FULL_41_41]OHA26067.1 MAG: hypothetical protein A3C06_00750 [Candidatus Taylorbacteria bacterium RIFCSPHIGHO2_02_FULL_46_13]
MDQEKAKQRALAFLKENDTMVIATASKSGEPQASTVYYVVDNDFNVFFITNAGTKKHDNLTKNNQVAFVVGFGPQVLTVQGGGIAQEMAEGYEQVYGQIMEKALKPADQWPPLFLSKKGQCVFKITPSWMVCLNLHKESHEAGVQEDFCKII